MKDVFFFEAFAEEADALRALLPDRIEAGFTGRTIQAEDMEAPPARLISTRTQSALPTAWVPGIDGVLTRSTGYDHVLDWRRASGVAFPAGYLPDYCTRAVAEHCLLLWSALARRLPRQTAQFTSFMRDGLTGQESGGRNLLVVGVGRIGGDVARIGQALGMNVRGVDIIRRHDFVDYTGIDAGLAWAEIIVCCMNLTADNHAYFNAARWAGVRTGALFVNCARGELSPAADLLRALEDGLLGGVGLDVYEDEPAMAECLRGGRTNDVPAALRAVCELAKRKDVILTPHNAFNTREALARKVVRSIESAVQFLSKGTFPNPVPVEKT